MTRRIIVFLFLATAAQGSQPPAVQWGHQILTPTQDGIFGWMVVDSNDDICMVVSRETEDSSGNKSKEPFVLKYDPTGQALWSRQLGANGTGEPWSLSVDGLTADGQGNIYVFGHTGSSPEQENQGGYDAFYAKYRQDGTREWIRLLGTPGHDVCAGLAVDADQNLYVAGYTYGALAKPNQGKADMFIAVFDPHGATLWRDQIGTEVDERITDLRLGRDNDLYFCATTAGSLGRQNNGQDDIVVGRYERSGKCLWVYQCGTPMSDTAVCMEVGEHSEVYVGGRTEGHLAFSNAQRGYGDAYVMRLSETGEVLWTRQFGTLGWDKTFQLACFTDGSGDVLASGCQIPRPACQGFSRRYSAQGDLVWTQEFRQRGPRGGTCGRAIAIDSANNCYHAGVTNADTFTVNNGTRNVYLVKFNGSVEK